MVAIPRHDDGLGGSASGGSASGGRGLGRVDGGFERGQSPSVVDEAEFCFGLCVGLNRCRYWREGARATSGRGGVELSARRGGVA